MVKKKSILLSREAECVYYIIYIIFALYLRKDFFLLKPIPYFRIFFLIGLGVLMLFSGINAIKEKKVRLHSIMAKGSGTVFVGILLILGSLYFMFFVR